MLRIRTVAAIVLSAGWICPQAYAEPPFSTKTDVVCYHFKGRTLELRDLCKMENFDTSSVITWSDGVKTRIRWIARSRNVPAIDGIDATEYVRHPDTLEVIDPGDHANPVRCLQAIGSSNSVCWR
jgi:hypothetical protein